MEAFTTAGHAQLPDHNVKELTRRQEDGHGSKPSLLIAMIQAFGVPFVTAEFLRLISDLLTFVGPLVLG